MPWSIWKSQRRFTLNTRLKKITQSYSLPRISWRPEIYVSRRSYQKKNSLKDRGTFRICKSLPDAEPLPADRGYPGEILTVNVPFPEIFYYKM